MNGTGRAWIIFSGVVLGVAGVMRLLAIAVMNGSHVGR
jgi:hypothetical protein